MAITEKQRERRQKSIGGSDIATLLGHNPRSQYDLWLEKKHGVVTFEGNDATEFGQVVEGSIADWAAQKLGVKIRKNVFRASSNDPFHANLDAVVIGDMAAVEVKTTSYRVDEEWGEPGTDEVPHKVVCQCQWQMLVTDYDRVHVAAGLMPSFGGQKLRMFQVDRHDELQQFLHDEASAWWNKHIVGDEVPSDLPSEQAIKNITRVPNFERAIDPDLVGELLQAKADARLANFLVKELTKQLHKALYDPATEQWAEVGLLGEDRRVTYFEHYRKPEAKPRAGGHYRRLVLPKEL